MKIINTVKLVKYNGIPKYNKPYRNENGCFVIPQEFNSDENGNVLLSNGEVFKILDNKIEYQINHDLNIGEEIKTKEYHGEIVSRNYDPIDDSFTYFGYCIPNIQ